MLNILKKYQVSLGMDAAVLITLVGRAWSIFSGLITLYFVAKYTSPEVQGYYYTFSNIIGLQIFFELGLSFVLMQMVSHESHGLQLNQGVLEGSQDPKNKVFGLVKLALRVYAVAALCFLVIVWIGGSVFFARDAHSVLVDWKMPWGLTVVFTAGLLLISPMLAIYEGLGHVTTIARLRLIQFVCSGITTWILIAAGKALYALSAVAIITFFVQLVWVLRSVRKLILDAWRYHVVGGVSWRHEIWPFQWKIAVSWISGYFIFQLITPLVFSVKGAALAGKTGMAFAVSNAMISLSMAWINTKAPVFGALISTRRWDELNQIYHKTLRASLIFLMLLSVAVLACIYILRIAGVPILDKFPSLVGLSLMSFAVILNQVVFARAVYLRAAKREPFMVLSVATGVVNICFVYVAVKCAWDDAVFLAYCAATLFSYVWSGSIFKRLEYK